MIYWCAAASLGTFFIGYFLGLDKGMRSAHQVHMRQKQNIKSPLDKYKVKNIENVYDPIWSSKKPRLRLIKEDEDNKRV